MHLVVQPGARYHISAISGMPTGSLYRNNTLSLQDFVTTFRRLFVRFLAAVPPWFSADIAQGALTLKLDRNRAFGAEVYARALGIEDAADDVKYVYGWHLLFGVLEVLRLKHLRGGSHEVCATLVVSRLAVSRYMHTVGSLTDCS